jgi:hypothetical protein
MNGTYKSACLNSSFGYEIPCFYSPPLAPIPLIYFVRQSEFSKLYLFGHELFRTGFSLGFAGILVFAICGVDEQLAAFDLRSGCIVPVEHLLLKISTIFCIFIGPKLPKTWTDISSTCLSKAPARSRQSMHIYEKNKAMFSTRIRARKTKAIIFSTRIRARKTKAIIFSTRIRARKENAIFSNRISSLPLFGQSIVRHNKSLHNNNKIATMTGSLTATPAWKALAAHFEETNSATMKDMFAADPDRFEKFSLDFEGILLDYSKNRISDKTMKLLYGLAKQQDVSGLAKKMYAGEKISKYRRTLLCLLIVTDLKHDRSIAPPMMKI